MKILITGMTASQVLSQRRTIKYTTYVEVYKRLLEKLNHTVTVRVVTPGEDLREFDRVIVGLTPVNALNAKHMFGALWTLHLLRSGKVRGACHLHDWNVRAIFSSARAISKDFDKRLYQNAVLLRDHKEKVRDTPRLRRVIEDVIETISYGFCTVKVYVITPLLDGGDHSLLLQGTTMNKHQLWPIDVLGSCGWNRWAHEVKGWKPVKRRRAWIHAALPLDKGFAQRIRASSWGLELYGPASPDRRKIPEDQLIQQYWEVEGLIAMPYYHAGSGWCRARFVHAAALGTVIVCDKREGAVIGPSYTLSMKEIEILNSKQLRELAAAQARELKKVVWSEQQLIYELDGLIRRKT